MVEAGQVILILNAIAVIAACSVRFYLRIIIGRRFELLEFALIWAMVMQICFIGQQLRIFSLLPSMQNPSNVVQVQKLFFAGTFFYIGSLWGVKISIALLHIQLTRRFERIRFLAVCTLYFLLGSWLFIYLTYLAACWPVDRRWTLIPSRQCAPITQAWDFWTHFAIHLLTDIVLCILPFPALLKVTETRLRVAVCGVYSLTIVAIIVTVIRVVLLATDVQNSIKRIMILTSVEVTVCIVIGVLPGISSAFTRKYAHTSPGSSKSKPSSKLKSRQHNSQVISHVSENDPSTVGAGNNADAIELSNAYLAVASAEDKNDCHSLTGSTDQIIGAGKGGITKVTHIKVDVQDR